MKICPTCKQTYEDHFRFCTNDGTSLGDRPAPATLTSPDPAPEPPTAARATPSSINIATVEAELILPEPMPAAPPAAAAPVQSDPITTAEMPLASTIPAPGAPMVERSRGRADSGSVPPVAVAPDPGGSSELQTEAEYQADLESISKLRAQFESSTALPVIEPTDDDLRYLIKASRPRWIPWAFVGGAVVALAVAGWLYLQSRNAPPPAPSGIFSGEKAGPAGSGKSVQGAGTDQPADSRPDAALAVDMAAPEQPDAAPDLSIDSAPDVASPDVALPDTASPKAAAAARDKPVVKRRAKRSKSRTRRATRRSRSKKRSARRKTTRKRTRRTRKDTTIDPFAE